MTDAELAARFTELFSAVYLRFHRRTTRRAERVTAQQWGVLQHLSLTGPLTVGECARHLGRAQSVVSELIDGLEARGLLERLRDARDRRRVLVWLTDEAHAFVAREQQVLDHERLAAAAGQLSHEERRALLDGMRALVRAAEAAPGPAAARPRPRQERGR